MEFISSYDLHGVHWLLQGSIEFDIELIQLL
jgi:hypothetical protein